ncbi:hypothetical protein H4Q32_026721 [Labeo rohita]|uniref:Uncharacterized protein n=1 Tax=Labeo rohita TaxID=84645 RepID=A0ABQ8L2P3_LABRO|nr:hypothetical protein H4Q32_026721 [Labeo rohita]
MFLGGRHPVEAGAEAWGMGYPGAGCHGTDVAEASSVRLSGESAPGWGPSSFSSPVLAGLSMVLGSDFPSRRLSMGDSRQEGSPLSGGRHHPPPSPGVVGVMGVAPEGAHLVASGLSTKVVQTILQSRAPSTRKLYALKWKPFTSWCEHRQQDPVNCPVGTVLEYLQDQFSTGLAHSTLRVYVTAISAYHAPLGGMSVGKDPLVVRFLRGALRLRPPVRPRVPTWDLAVVPEALCRPPFEPIEESLDHHLSAKTAFLLALTSLMRTGVCSESPLCSTMARCTPGLLSSHTFCLDTYVHRAAMWRKTDQLFVCYGPPRGVSMLPSIPLAAGLWMLSLRLMSSQTFPLPWGLRPILPEASPPPKLSCLVSLCRTSVTQRDGPCPLSLSGSMT